jgi:hypothetical protein
VDRDSDPRQVNADARAVNDRRRSVIWRVDHRRGRISSASAIIAVAIAAVIAAAIVIIMVTVPPFVGMSGDDGDA